MIAAFGCNGFTGGHLTVLQYHGVKRVMIAFDRDEAGDRGAEVVAAELQQAGIEAWRVRFPAGMDANSYGLKSGNPESAFALALEQAVRMGSGTEALSEAVTASDKTSSPLATQPGVQTAAVSAETPAIACEVTASGELLLRSGPRVWRVRGWLSRYLQEVRHS